jgi:RES domain-containing protein
MPKTEAGSMPDGWDALPYSGISQIVGDEWLESGRTAVLAVPSVVVPQEWNFLLNPKHRNFHKIKIADKVITPFDSRLIRI